MVLYCRSNLNQTYRGFYLFFGGTYEEEDTSLQDISNQICQKSHRISVFFVVTFTEF